MRNSRSDVVAAGMRVLGEHGLEGCSMRRVATELGVQPGALYHHVPNKQTLLALMADEIVADVAGRDGAGAGAGAGWGSAGASGAVGASGVVDAGGAADLCRSLRDAMLRVRDGADVVATASAFRLGASRVEAELAGLVGSAGARTLLLYTFGHAQSTQTHLQARSFGALVVEAGAPGVGDPADSGAASGSDDAALEASFDEGLAIICRGLAA